MQTVYADVLIILNIYVNFFLLRTTARLTHSPLRTVRCIAASVYGSLFSLTILLPPLGTLLNTAIKSAAAVTVVLAGFGFNGWKRLLADTCAFFGTNFLMAGAVYAVYSWFRPDFIRFNNTYFYIDFSLLILVFTTSAMYLIVCIVRFFADRSIGGEYRVTVRYGKKTVTMKGLADTGNVLTDCFTGCPVVICDKTKFDGYVPKGLRFIPFSTVSEYGLMAVFRADEVIIENTAAHSRKRADVLIGLGDSRGEAVFNPKLLKI